MNSLVFQIEVILTISMMFYWMRISQVDIGSAWENFLDWLKPDNWEDQKVDPVMKIVKVGDEFVEKQVIGSDGEPKFAKIIKGRRHDIWRHLGWLLLVIAAEVFLLIFVSVFAGKFLFHFFLSVIIGGQVFFKKKEGRGWKTKVFLSALSFLISLILSSLFLDGIIANFQLAVYCIIAAAILVWLIDEKTGKDIYPKSVGWVSLFLFLFLIILTISNIFEGSQYWDKSCFISLEESMRIKYLEALLARTGDGIFSLNFWEYYSLKIKENLPAELGRWSYLFNMAIFLLSYLIAFFFLFLVASWEKVSGWFKEAGEKKDEKKGEGGLLGNTLLGYFTIDGITDLAKAIFKKKGK